MSELPAILDAIGANPDDEARWLVLARWLWDNGRDNEGAVARVYWPTLAANMVESGVSLEGTLEDLRRNASLLGRLALDLKGRLDQRLMGD